MSRHRSDGSYNHTIKRVGRDWFRLYWTVDRYYPSSRLRFPRGSSRDTDFAGAQRFAKKWELPAPEDEDAIAIEAATAGEMCNKLAPKDESAGRQASPK